MDAKTFGAGAKLASCYPQGMKVAQIRRLRPKSHDRAAQALQLMLELPLVLTPATRSELTDALSSYAPQPWVYIMLSREQARIIQERINTGPRPGVTLGVWMAALSYAAYSTGEIEATREQLAKLAGTTDGEVSRALARLAKIGALVRSGHGRYALNPAVAWSGPLASREQAVAAQKPGLHLVEPA
jgi:CRP-like cAMP-binding protein